jgi:predicted PurR-regulated permease PerM
MTSSRNRSTPATQRRRQRWPAGPAAGTVAGSSGTRPERIQAFRVGLFGALGVGVGLVVWAAVSSLATLIVYVGLAAFAALGLDPVVRWLEARNLPRPLAVVLVLSALGLAVTALLYWIIPLLVAEVRALLAYLPLLAEQILRSEWVNNLAGVLNGFLDLEEMAADLAGFLSDPDNLIALGGGLLSVGAGLAGGITGAVFVLILTVYFLASLGRMKKAAYRLVPASRRPAFIDVSEDTAHAISRYLVGEFALSLINGLLSAVYLNLIHAPGPMLLAVLAALGSFVPMVGTLASSAVITAVCLTASPQTALAAGIYYLLYMQVEAYILTPRIMDKAVEIPGSLVLVAVVAGGTLGGILGALVAVPLAASAVIIVRKVVIPRQDSR